MRIHLLILIALLLFGCTAQQGQKQLFGEQKDILCIKGKTCIEIERAITTQQHMTGLMNRQSLDQNKGMLFLFKDPAPKSFWMKNTPIPLDIIWVSVEKKIVGIQKNALPCRQPTCPSYQSNALVKFVLEVNGGFSDKHNILLGDSMEFGQ